MSALLAELELERGVLAPRLETIFLGGGTPTFTGSGRARAAAGRAARRGRGHGRGEPRDGHARAGRASNPWSCQPRVARRAVVRPCAARRARAALRPRRRSPRGARSAGRRLREHLARSPLRHPGPDPRRPRHGHRGSARARPPSTSRTTSSRRSPGRASRTRTGRSSAARRRRWRATSSASSRRSSARATAGTRPRTSAVPGGRRGTTWATGSAATTWASGSAPCPRSARTAGGTRRAWRATSAALGRGETPAA